MNKILAISRLLRCCFIDLSLEMQKQKKSRAILTKEKPKVKSDIKHLWRQDSFAQLYPQAPEVTTTATFFVVGLNYHGSLIKVKVPTGIENKNLPYLFHQEIYRHLLNIKQSNPLLKTAQVVGFQSVDQDLLLDYQISIGKGILSKKACFNCLEYVSEGRLKKYKISKCLAIGGFSKVYLVRSLRDGVFYAMKVMQKKFISENQKENIIENQKQICSMLNHPFIVKLNHCFETHNFVCFVFDYCPGGELFYYLKSVKRMTEPHAKFYFIEILYALMYLHQQNIIYRDLKPENLLINHDGHLKIADFGLSKLGINNREVTYSFCGSTEYMPPEMILRQGHSYGVDFYTLGALLYQLVTGLPPFYSRNEEQIKYAIVNQQISFPDNLELSGEIKNLLSGLLHKNPKQRIGSMKGLKQVLFHPWLGRINSEAVLSKKLEPPYFPSVKEFNFDENQLGDDEADFTRSLLMENMIPPSKEKLQFRDFDFHNESYLRPEVKNIYESYQQKQKGLPNYSSSKSLKKSMSKSSLKRQHSSPYLLMESKDKTIKNRVTRRNKSLDAIKHKGSNILRSSSKKRTVHLSPKPETIHVVRREKENNPFLKKKKVIYNYLKQMG